jgi:hypothetical protein
MVPSGTAHRGYTARKIGSTENCRAHQTGVAASWTTTGRGSGAAAGYKDGRQLAAPGMICHSLTEYSTNRSNPYTACPPRHCPTEYSNDKADTTRHAQCWLSPGVVSISYSCSHSKTILPTSIHASAIMHIPSRGVTSFASAAHV